MLRSGILPRSLAVAVLAAALALVVVAQGAAGAQGYGNGERTARIEVRVLQDVVDELDIYVSARAAVGSWRTLGNIPLPLDDGFSADGRYRFGDIALEVPFFDQASTVTVEVRVWQHVFDSARVHISARPADGSWDTLGTKRLLLDDGFSSTTGRRFGDIALDASLPATGVITLAGRAGFYGHEDGRGNEARFGWRRESISGLAVDHDGSVVVADFRNAAIRRVLPDGTVTTIAGGNGIGFRDGPVETAQFGSPTDIAIDPQGAIYVADCSGYVRKVADGMVTTVAGADHPEGQPRRKRDGPADEALFVMPCRIALDPEGDLYIKEQTQIRRLSPSGWVSTFAGGEQGYRNGPREQAGFDFTQDIDVDADGNVYVIDINGSVPGEEGRQHTVRKISAASGMVSTIYRNGPARRGGVLVSPEGLAVTPGGEVYVSNTGRNQIVRVEGPNKLTAVAGAGAEGRLDGPRWGATFNRPGALALTAEGSLVVMDQGDSVVRVIIPEGGGGFTDVGLAEVRLLPRLEGVRLEVFAGRGGYRFADVDGHQDGPAGEALFNFPHGIALAPDGSVVVADSGNHAIRRISPDGAVTTVAGGDGQSGRDEAQFSWPRGIAVDAAGVIYVADTQGGLIRRVASDGSVSTVAGADVPFSSPTEMAFDAEGNLLFAELNNSRILLLSPDGGVSVRVNERSGFMYGLAIGDDGTVYYATARLPTLSIRKSDGDGFITTVFEDVPGRFGGAFSDYVPGLALAADGTLYAVDWQYGRVVRISPDGEAALVVDRDWFNGSPHFQPADILITPEGALLVADSGMSVIWKITLPDEEPEVAE
ncbi:MAG: hypothetical protein F4Z07_12480 [Dehalococcoidia bacterium]|nr:hypothetical protein [Dehalococcoidia bacterium]